MIAGEEAESESLRGLFAGPYFRQSGPMWPGLLHRVQSFCSIRRLYSSLEIQAAGVLVPESLTEPFDRAVFRELLLLLAPLLLLGLLPGAVFGTVRNVRFDRVSAVFEFELELELEPGCRGFTNSAAIALSNSSCKLSNLPLAAVIWGLIRLWIEGLSPDHAISYNHRSGHSSQPASSHRFCCRMIHSLTGSSL